MGIIVTGRDYPVYFAYACHGLPETECPLVLMLGHQTIVPDSLTLPVGMCHTSSTFCPKELTNIVLLWLCVRPIVQRSLY